MTVTRYRKRPVEVDTIQWTGDNEAELIEFTNHHFEAVPPEDRAEDPEITAQVFDVLHSTWVGVKTGQHVIRGVKGEFYPIDVDVLAETYDPAVPAPATDRAALAARLWQIAEHHIAAEWICCDSIDSPHDLCAQGRTALRMLRSLLVDDPTAWRPAPVLDAVLAEIQAVSSAGQPVPAADRAGLREQIATAVDGVFEAWRDGLGDVRPQDALVDAVLAVLFGPIPAGTDVATWTAIRAIQLMNEAGRQRDAAASVDRVTVLNEAARTVAADAALRETEGEYALAEYGYELARLIRPKDLPAVVPGGAGEEPAGVTLRCVCGDPVQLRDEIDPSSWIHSPGSATPCLNARPRCPHCQMPHDLDPSSGAPAACASILASIRDRDAAEPVGGARQPKEARP
jgi:hypothetical protein